MDKLKIQHFAADQIHKLDANRVSKSVYQVDGDSEIIHKRSASGFWANKQVDNVPGYKRLSVVQEYLKR